MPPGVLLGFYTGQDLPLTGGEDWISAKHAALDIPLDDFLRQRGASEEALRLINVAPNTNDIATTSALWALRNAQRRRALADAVAALRVIDVAPRLRLDVRGLPPAFFRVGPLLEGIERIAHNLGRAAGLPEDKLPEAAEDAIEDLTKLRGVGRKTAEVLVTALDDVDRFDNARQVSAYIGLVPRQYQSGETDRNGRITKRGSRLVRTILLECAWAALKYNAWARVVFERIAGGQKNRRKKAAVALARTA